MTAADRARKLDRKEALEVLNDAIAGNDPDFGHAIGTRARNLGWEDVAHAYTAAYPDTADSAAALSWVESNTSGAAYNIANQMTYAPPTDWPPDWVGSPFPYPLGGASPSTRSPWPCAGGSGVGCWPGRGARAL